VSKKIRDAELRKVPYMLVVGDQEEDDRRVSVRRHREGDLGAMSVGDLVARLTDEIARRA
jgi:threonyl-tRNA synthetase